MEFDSPDAEAPAPDGGGEFAKALEETLEGGPIPATEAPEAGTSQVKETTTQPEGGEDVVPKSQYDELRSLMGRMSSELGELRQLVKGEEPEPEPAFEPGVPTPLTESLYEEIEGLIQRDGGEQVATWAAINRPDILEATLDIWADQGGAAARRSAEFSLRYQNAVSQYQQEAEAEAAAQAEKELAETLQTSLKALAPEFGFNVDSPEVDEFLGTTLDEAPKFIQQAVVSEDEEIRQEAVRAVLELARNKLATTGGDKPPADNADALAELRRVKEAAMIGGRSFSPLPSADKMEGEVVTGTDMIDAVRSLLTQGDSTSVAAGLTGGKPT